LHIRQNNTKISGQRFENLIKVHVLRDRNANDPKTFHKVLQAMLLLADTHTGKRFMCTGSPVESHTSVSALYVSIPSLKPCARVLANMLYGVGVGERTD
jgi:hypothetical protein